jgi:ATP phosphoribosyltransferase regulatory subunit
MRDLLPAEARARRALARRVLEHFALHGYQLVTPPVFELAEVLERGLGTLDPSDVLRFVEPESGEVAALRPDMTPQIARMVATRLAREPSPIRLCYEGSIVRRRQGGARRHRQVPQAGVELYGTASLAGDLEVLELAASVTRAVGLEDVVVDLGHASIARSLLDAVPDRTLASELADALVHTDASRVDALLSAPRAAAVPTRVAGALAALPDLSGGGVADPGGARVFARASALLAGTPAEAALAELRALWDAARGPSASRRLADVLTVDVGEVRGFAYYTGAIFHVLAEGPGEPVAAGGRYDDLLGRFDAPMPAVGFALHLDAVAWAREVAGVVEPAAPRVVVALSSGGEALVEALRRAGVAAVAHGDAEGAKAYARAWGFSHVVTGAPGAVSTEVVAPSEPLPVDPAALSASG